MVVTSDGQLLRIRVRRGDRRRRTGTLGDNDDDDDDEEYKTMKKTRTTNNDKILPTPYMKTIYYDLETVLQTIVL